MSMNDPISDMLARIRNALLAGRDQVEMPASRLKEQICSVMLREGYITGYKIVEDGPRKMLLVSLKYLSDRSPVIQGLRRVSRPSLRIHVSSDEIRPVRSGLGISIISTSQGVMTGKQARQTHTGGEVLCEVW
ncbi:MAG: 30S ribosomal protein S8 [Candidatus Hydrogenedentes bacterium]|nr:30S ribosomal protein S8 [Candidatus Hydrogenedentota bacterium]